MEKGLSYLWASSKRAACIVLGSQLQQGKVVWSQTLSSADSQLECLGSAGIKSQNQLVNNPHSKSTNSLNQPEQSQTKGLGNKSESANLFIAEFRYLPKVL